MELCLKFINRLRSGAYPRGTSFTLTRKGPCLTGCWMGGELSRLHAS